LPCKSEEGGPQRKEGKEDLPPPSSVDLLPLLKQRAKRTSFLFALCFNRKSTREGDRSVLILKERDVICFGRSSALEDPLAMVAEALAWNRLSAN
jgi:hypothetical protein